MLVLQAEDACSPGSSLYGSRTLAVCAVITQFVVRTHSFCRKYAKVFVVLTPHCAKQNVLAILTHSVLLFSAARDLC